VTLSFGVISLLPPEFFRFFTEHVHTLSSVSADAFLRQLALFGLVVSVTLLLSTVGTTLTHEWLRLRLEAELRRRVLKRLHEVPLTVLDDAQRGDWLTRMTGDLGQVETFLTESVPGQMRNVAVLLGAGALFFVHSGWVALLPLLSALILSLIHLRVQHRIAPVLAELRGLHGGIFQLLIESLEGIRTIRSHSGEPYVRGRFDAKLDRITTKSFRVVRLLGLFLGGTDFAGELMVTACLSAVAWSLAGGGMTLDQALFYPFFIGMFYGAASGLAHAAYDWNRFFIEGGRLSEMLNGHGSTPLTEPGQIVQARTGRLQVEGLIIGHGDRQLAGPLDFQVAKGELWTVVGPSGCGKSTFLEVLAGLRPAQSGSISLADKYGILWESTAVTGARLPIGPCAYVEQRPYIFEGTLRENLTFGNPQRLSDADLWQGLEKAGLFAFAHHYGGLDHFLRDRGQNLSEGERYRIALCRALLLHRPFLLLDEPFAALDEVSVRLVVATLQAHRAQTGIVLVTHFLPEGLSATGHFDFKAFRSPKAPVMVRGAFEREGRESAEVISIGEYNKPQHSVESERSLLND
jgi:ABC-type multidrug transport system fused ATPase/permease subunit